MWFDQIRSYMEYLSATATDLSCRMVSIQVHALQSDSMQQQQACHQSLTFDDGGLARLLEIIPRCPTLLRPPLAVGRAHHSRCYFRLLVGERGTSKCVSVSLQVQVRQNQGGDDRRRTVAISARHQRWCAHYPTYGGWISSRALHYFQKSSRCATFDLDVRCEGRVGFRRRLFIFFFFLCHRSLHLFILSLVVVRCSAGVGCRMM